MKEFKVGERVRVYDRQLDSDTTGVVTTGVVTTPDGSGKVWVRLSSADISLSFYPQQLRRLKPKREPRTIWVNEYADGFKGSGVHQKRDTADREATAARITCVEFREVIKK